MTHCWLRSAAPHRCSREELIFKMPIKIERFFKNKLRPTLLRPLLRSPALRAEADDDKPGRGVRLGLTIYQQSTLMSLLSLVSPQSSKFWKSLTIPWLTVDIVHIVSWLHQVLFEHGLVRVVLISPTRTVKTFEEILLRWKDVTNVFYLLSFNLESQNWARITVVMKRRIIAAKCL